MKLPSSPPIAYIERELKGDEKEEIGSKLNM